MQGKNEREKDLLANKAQDESEGSHKEKIIIKHCNQWQLLVFKFSSSFKVIQVVRI